MSEVVFDASALVALLREEPGSKIVEGYLSAATINTVNLSEVIAKLIKHGMSEKVAIDIVFALGLRTIVFDEDMACRCAALIAITQKAGLSLGDRACIAAAQKLKLPVITADRSWSKLNLDCEVKVVR